MAHSKEKRAYARRMLADGKSRKDIAWVVEISKTTVAFWALEFQIEDWRADLRRAPQQARSGEPRAMPTAPCSSNRRSGLRLAPPATRDGSTDFTWLAALRR